MIKLTQNSESTTCSKSVNRSSWSYSENRYNPPNSLEGAGNVLLLEEDVKFCENIREFANYAYSLKDFIRKYELLQYKIEVLESTIEAKKAGLFLLGKPEVGNYHTYNSD